jgi:hypothetical protein
MVNGLKLSDLQKKWADEMLGADGASTHSLVEYKRQTFDCFECEFTIRPSDNALVVHLKYLPPLLRHPSFFRHACILWREKIGAFRNFETYYTGKLNDANKIYSLDMVFTEYYPAILGDMRFMERHIFKIASEFNYKLVSEMQGRVVRKGER